MHYFKRNIGDYHKKAGRLSMLEHGAYTLLIDSCYDRERFPSLDDAIEWTWAKTDEEIAAVKFVLSKFFLLQEGFFIQKRIIEEIENYHSNSATNKRIAQEREEKRRLKTARSVHEPYTNEHEPPPNQEPLTNNHKPLTNKKSLSAQNAQTSKKGTRLTPEWVLSKTLGDWALKEKPHLTADNIRRLAESFRDYWIATPGAKGVKLDWEATWRNWVRKDTTDWQKSTGGALASAVTPVKYICEVENCGKPANVKTSKGHRCAGHIAK